MRRLNHRCALGRVNVADGGRYLGVKDDPRDLDASGEEVDSAEWRSSSVSDPS